MREQELQGNVSVNEYVEIESGYSVQDSKRAFEQEREEQNKCFAIGEPLLFDAENCDLVYPVKTDKNGAPITDVDEDGNEFYVRDEEKKPYIRFVKYNAGKKAVANVQVQSAVDMLERLAVSLEDKQAGKVKDILETVFPKKTVSFGTFTMSGDRELKKQAFHVFQKSKIVLYSLPIMEKTKKGQYEPKTLVYSWVETDADGNKQEHTITLCYYQGKEIDGAQLGYAQ